MYFLIGVHTSRTASSSITTTTSTDPGETPAVGSEDVVWFKQTINNACGLYGLLHAVRNGGAGEHVQPDTVLSSIIEKFHATVSADRFELLQTADMESAYHRAASKGDMAAPEDPRAEVESHYTCFEKADGKLWELDGDLEGAVVVG